MHQSIATIQSPEFINLQPLDINPLMSKCEIKVFQLGENRNRSVIDRETALNMAKTLRGAPIVGYWKEEKQDFEDHGERVIFDGEGVHFDCLTRPYGFVATDAEIWFKDFEDIDEQGQPIIHTYLMTTGYLWTGQYPELNATVTEGRPQSMELDNDTLKGSWTENTSEDIGFFIINDAVISKLCILGSDVEPCFEGASVEVPSHCFSKLDNEFKLALQTMMKQCAAYEEGHKKMETTDTTKIEEIAEDTSLEEVVFEKKDDEKEEKVDETAPADKEEDAPAEKDETPAEDEDEDKKKPPVKNTLEELPSAEFTQLVEKVASLSARVEELEAENQSLREFKLIAERKQKTDKIAEFYMLDDADKKEVLENIDKYSLNEIEGKLAVIYFKKNISFEKEAKEEQKQESVLTYNLAESAVKTSVPEWAQAAIEYTKE